MGERSLQTKGGVLWDMDGVLVDTGDYHYRAWSKVISEQGIHLTNDMFRSTFGMNNEQILGILMGDRLDARNKAEISNAKEEAFRQAIQGNAKLLPGVLKWLKRLSEWGLKQAIASSAPPANIDALVSELDIGSYFDAIVSGEDLPSKPDPAVFLEAARIIGVDPEGCVVIEDSTAGIEAAVRAGIRCVAVATTNPIEDLGLAEVTVMTLDELDDEVFAI